MLYKLPILVRVIFITIYFLLFSYKKINLQHVFIFPNFKFKNATQFEMPLYTPFVTYQFKQF